ncbi:MAG: lipopolysaccharide export system permease protein [Pseudohongiellaceae bacterium]
MIIFRYLAKQVLQIMAAVSLILMVVALTSRFIQYLAQAVAGELASDVLLLLMLYRLPDFLLVIVPLALFLGILLAYGRMYADNEMVVLLGSGISQLKLLLLTQGAAALVIVVMSFVSLSLAPWGVRNTEQLKLNQAQLTEIDLIVAGQFQSFADGQRVTYAERLSARGEVRRLENVFVAAGGGADTEPGSGSAPRIVIAESAIPEIDPESGARFMRLENVLQYEGRPGQRDFSVGQFDVQSILLPDAAEFEEFVEEAALRTTELFGSNSLERQAELQWRFSIILLIPIITLIAVPMSKVNPRQGRYSKLIPAALLYAVYFFLLQFSRDGVAEGEINPTLGLWWVHALFIILGVIIYQPNGLRLALNKSAS